MAALASVTAKALALVDLVSDQWFSVSPYVLNSSCPDPLNITATPCGGQLLSNAVLIASVLIRDLTMLVTECLVGMNGAYVY